MTISMPISRTQVCNKKNALVPAKMLKLLKLLFFLLPGRTAKEKYLRYIFPCTWVYNKKKLSLGESKKVLWVTPFLYCGLQKTVQSRSFLYDKAYIAGCVDCGDYICRGVVGPKPKKSVGCGCGSLAIPRPRPMRSVGCE